MAYLTGAGLLETVDALSKNNISAGVLDDLVAEFEELAERYRGVAYEPRYAVETFLPVRAADALPLRWAAVRNIVSVVVTNSDATTTTLDSTEYSLDRAASAVVVTAGQDVPVTVTYQHGLGARTVTDGVTTDTDATVTSATAAFTVADIGEPITGTGIPTSATIASVNSSTSVELSAVATATGTGISFTIGAPPATVLRACRLYVRSCALSDQSSIPRDVIGQSFEGTYTRYSTPDWDAGRPTGYLDVDRLLNTLDDYRTGFA